jgi:hypothetical protein
MHDGTTSGKKNSGFTGISGISTRINFVTVDMEVTPNPLLFLPATVRLSKNLTYFI